jgi:hypothetical protein
MSKQTALQWLVNEYAKAFKIPVNAVMLGTIEEALQMEREQIIDARQDGVDAVFKGYSISNEEYYKQTYGGQNE